MFLLYLWYICSIIQSLLAFGTAYRMTRKGGDNGVALFGWLFLTQLAALIPGLGFYLWKAYKAEEEK